MRVLAVLFAPLLAAAAWAHDFWIEPPKYRFERGETVQVPLRFGEELVGEPAARNELRIEKFVVVGPDGEKPVAGEDGKDPAGRFAPQKDGLYVVAYRGKRMSIELEAAKFEAYLREEGLDQVVRIREERGETEKGGREVFSRCAKTIVLVGDPPGSGHDRVTGMRLEIVPETNPYAITCGSEMTFRVLFDGKPLSKAYLVARSRSVPKRAVTARADSQGRATLKLAEPGEWMVKCVHMVAAPAETGMDWESLWASLTFDLAPKEVGGR